VVGFQTIGAVLLLDCYPEAALDFVFCAYAACFLARVSKSWALVAS
jgi:hypothetical protein